MNMNILNNYRHIVQAILLYLTNINSAITAFLAAIMPHSATQIAYKPITINGSESFSSNSTERKKIIDTMYTQYAMLDMVFMQNALHGS